MSDPILHLLPEDQLHRVLRQEMVDIDPSFLGFTQIYKNLAEIIPLHFTVIDFGCAYNAQCFCFKDHLRYVAVDVGIGEQFQAENCELHNMTTGQFIEKHLHEYDLDETFAICSYVPPWYSENSIDLVRHAFKNVFTYYPHGGDSPSKRLGKKLST